MQRVWIGGVLAAAWLSASLVAQAPLTELRGDGFVLRGQVSTGTLTAVACDLETAVKLLERSASNVERPTFAVARPMVVAVDSARGIREWLPEFNDRGRGNPLGAYWRGLYGDHIVVRIDAPPAERRRRVLHEYAHFMTHAENPDPAPWLDEGISEIWEHAVISANAIEVGRPIKQHLKRLRSGKDWIPVRELVALNAIPTRPDAAREMFYAESWALAHYRMFERSGDIPTDAALKTYVRGSMGASIKISTPTAQDCSGRTTIGNVSPLQSLLGRAQALADGERPDAALPLLLQGLVLSPSNIGVTETIGFVHFRGNRPVEAAAVFDRVIRAGGASHISYYYRAVLAGPIPERSEGEGPVPQVEYLRKAIALNPGFAPAVQRLRELTGKGPFLALRPRL